MNIQRTVEGTVGCPCHLQWIPAVVDRQAHILMVERAVEIPGKSESSAKHFPTVCNIDTDELGVRKSRVRGILEPLEILQPSDAAQLHGMGNGVDAAARPVFPAAACGSAGPSGVVRIVDQQLIAFVPVGNDDMFAFRPGEQQHHRAAMEPDRALYGRNAVQLKRPPPAVVEVHGRRGRLGKCRDQGLHTSVPTATEVALREVEVVDRVGRHPEGIAPPHVVLDRPVFDAEPVPRRVEARAESVRQRGLSPCPERSDRKRGIRIPPSCCPGRGFSP